MNLKEILKDTWRTIRVTQPFNFIATETLVALCGIGLDRNLMLDHFPRIGPVKCKLPNNQSFVLTSHGDDHLVNYLFWKGGDQYEPETSRLFFDLASSAHCTIDVGAHVGFYSLLAGRANPDGRIYAFEPFRRVYDRLQENVERNDLPNVRCFPVALGEKNEMTQLYHVTSDDIPTNSSLTSHFIENYDNVAVQPVQKMTLDTFIQEQKIPRVDLVKLDTEGTEHLSLQGMRETLERDHPTIFCEVLSGSGNEQAIHDALDGLGYHYYWLNKKGVKQVERITGQKEEWNYVFSTQPLSKIRSIQ